QTLLPSASRTSMLKGWAESSGPTTASKRLTERSCEKAKPSRNEEPLSVFDHDIKKRSSCTLSNECDVSPATGGNERRTICSSAANCVSSRSSDSCLPLTCSRICRNCLSYNARLL